MLSSMKAGTRTQGLSRNGFSQPTRFGLPAPRFIYTSATMPGGRSRNDPTLMVVPAQHTVMPHWGAGVRQDRHVAALRLMRCPLGARDTGLQQAASDYSARGGTGADLIVEALERFPESPASMRCTEGSPLGPGLPTLARPAMSPNGTGS